MTQHIELGSPAGRLVLASRTDYEVKLSGPSPNPGGSLFIECGEGVLVGFDPIEVGTITEMTIHWPTAGRGVIDGLMGDGAYQFILNGDSAQTRYPDSASAEVRHLAGTLAFAEHFRRLPGCADRQDLWHLDVTVLADQLVELGFEFEAVAAASAPAAAKLLLAHYTRGQVKAEDLVVTELMPAVARHLDPYSEAWQWLDSIVEAIKGVWELPQTEKVIVYREGEAAAHEEVSLTIDLRDSSSLVIPRSAIAKLDPKWAIVGAEVSQPGGVRAEVDIFIPADLDTSENNLPIFATILRAGSNEILRTLTLRPGIYGFSGEFKLPEGLSLDEIDVWVTDRLPRPIPPAPERALQRGQSLAKLARHAALYGHEQRASQLYRLCAQQLNKAGDAQGGDRANKLARHPGPGGLNLYRYRGLPKPDSDDLGPDV